MADAGRLPRWSADPEAEARLAYGGAVEVRLPAECADPDGGFVAIPSLAGADGFVLFEASAADLSEDPDVPGCYLWQITEGRTYKAARTKVRNGMPVMDANGAVADKASFSAAEALGFYLSAAMDPDPEKLLEKAFAKSGECDDLLRQGAKRAAASRMAAETVLVRYPAELVAPSEAGWGAIFPDGKGIGAIGGPGVAFRNGVLALGRRLDTVWRIRDDRFEPMIAELAGPVLRRAAAAWAKMSPEEKGDASAVSNLKLPPWPSPRGAEAVLDGVRAERIMKSDVAGTVQVAVGDPDSPDGIGFVLVPEKAAGRGSIRRIVLGMDWTPCAYRISGGDVRVRPAGEIAALDARGVPVLGGSVRGGGRIRLGGISRAGIEEDYGNGTSVLEFDGADGRRYGLRLDTYGLREGADGLLEIDLGVPDDPVGAYLIEDGMPAGNVPMTAGRLAELLPAATGGADGNGGRT